MRPIARLLVWNALAALFVVFVIGGMRPWAPWRDVVESLAVSFVFATCIGSPATLLMPRVGRYAWHRFTTPVSWLLLFSAFVAIAIAGSVVAIGVLVGIGYVPRHQATQWLVSSLWISILATLTFGGTITIYETMRARLEAATLALRTKERDEAEARRLAAESRLAALEARVQPHFLFNTLNSISALIPADPQGAEQMVSRLSALLRANLAATSPLVPVADELAAVRDYLEIERVRFDQRLRYMLPTARLREDLLVPRLSIQTLVENSVKYAVSPRRQGAAITVRVEHAGDRLRIAVEDDGPGFDASQWPHQHGLSLLRERLLTLYGTDATLVIDGTPGRCTVTLDVPASTAALRTEGARASA